RRQRDVASIEESLAQRRRPLRRQVGVHGNDKTVAVVELRAADRVDRAVRGHGGRGVDARPLRAARSEWRGGGGARRKRKLTLARSTPSSRRTFSMVPPPPGTHTTFAPRMG